MKSLLMVMFVLLSLSFAQKSTIDLNKFKNNKNYAFAEVPLKVGAHTFSLINIKPLAKSDTACVSAIIIDKRKYVLYDIGVEGGTYGLFVCKQQPLKEGIIVLKASPQTERPSSFIERQISVPSRREYFCRYNGEKHLLRLGK